MTPEQEALAELYFALDDRDLGRCWPDTRYDGGTPEAPVHHTAAGSFPAASCPMCLARECFIAQEQGRAGTPAAEPPRPPGTDEPMPDAVTETIIRAREAAAPAAPETCPECGGRGQKFTFANGMVTCPSCGGSGQAPGAGRREP